MDHTHHHHDHTHHDHAHHHDGKEDGDQHGHQHRLQRKFRFAVVLTIFVLGIEIVGGILSNSLALLSDAAHVFSDSLSLIMSWLAIYLSTRPATSSRTYGYHRTEVFAAFINGVSLIAISGWIFYEATHRFMEPEPVKSKEMLIVATIGFIANMVIVWLFHGEGHKSLNVRSAVLHVIGDALASVGVIVGGGSDVLDRLVHCRSNSERWDWYNNFDWGVQSNERSGSHLIGGVPETCRCSQSGSVHQCY